MQTTNFREFFCNFNSDRTLSNSPKALEPSALENNLICSEQARKNDVSLKAIDDLLELAPVKKVCKASSKGGLLTPMLQHLAFLKRISDQILPLFPPCLQQYLQIGHLRGHILIIYADSAQSARLARGYRDHICHQCSTMDDPFQSIETIKVAVNPQLKILSEAGIPKRSPQQPL